jgi:hypothetical protein
MLVQPWLPDVRISSELCRSWTSLRNEHKINLVMGELADCGAAMELAVETFEKTGRAALPDKIDVKAFFFGARLARSIELLSAAAVDIRGVLAQLQAAAASARAKAHQGWHAEALLFLLARLLDCANRVPKMRDRVKLVHEREGMKMPDIALDQIGFELRVREPRSELSAEKIETFLREGLQHAGEKCRSEFAQVVACVDFSALDINKDANAARLLKGMYDRHRLTIDTAFKEHPEVPALVLTSVEFETSRESDGKSTIAPRFNRTVLYNQHVPRPLPTAHRRLLDEAFAGPRVGPLSGGNIDPALFFAPEKP